MKRLAIVNTENLLEVKESVINDSIFLRACMERLSFEDVNLSGTKITNANMSDIEIEGAQLGGAYIHNIGMPPKDHPAYDPAARQRPLIFEDCFLAGSRISNCNLTDVELTDCNTSGMKINGVRIDDMIDAYKKSKGS